MRVRESIYEGEEPVTKQKAIALAVNEAVRGSVSNHLESRKSKLYRRLGLGLLGTIFGLGLLFTGSTVVGGTILFGGLIAGLGGGYFVLADDPDLTVNRVQKGYWTGYAIPSSKGGTIVYDATGSVQRSTFMLQKLDNMDTVLEAQDQLSSIDDLPVLLADQENVEQQVTDVLGSVQQELSATERHAVKLPIVSENTSVEEAIEHVIEDARAEPVSTDVEVSKDDAVADVEALIELEELAATEDSEAELETLRRSAQELVTELSGKQKTAVKLLNDHIKTAADVFGIVSYHFYCPGCQVDGIDSRLTLSDIKTGEWHCKTCRSTHGTADVIPRHRIKDDLVNPIWDNLWIEKDDERRRIYENIEDQKQELKEREFEQRREEIRTVADRIHDLRSRIRDLRTQAKAAEGTVDEIGSLMVRYERLNQNRKEQFEAEVEETFSEIDQQTRQLLEKTRNEEQKRLEEAEKEAEQRAELLREDERRREVTRLMAEQQMANERLEHAQKRADARVNAQMAQKQEHHEQNQVLDTRGKLSFSDTINSAYYKKNQLLGATKNGGSR